MADPTVRTDNRSARESEASEDASLATIARLAAGVPEELSRPLQFIGDNLHFLREGLNGLFQLLAKYEELQTVVGDDEKYAAIVQELTELAEAIDKDFLIEELPGAVERSVEGNQRVDNATVLAFAEIPRGRAITAGELNDAYQRVVNSGLFERVDFTPRGGRLTTRQDLKKVAPTIRALFT